MLDNYINVIYKLNETFSLHISVYEEKLKKDTLLKGVLNEIENTLTGFTKTLNTKSYVYCYDTNIPSIFLRNDFTGAIILYNVSYGKMIYNHGNYETYFSYKTFRNFLEENGIRPGISIWDNLFMQADKEKINYMMKEFVEKNIPQGYKVNYTIEKV